MRVEDAKYCVSTIFLARRPKNQFALPLRLSVSAVILY